MKASCAYFRIFLEHNTIHVCSKPAKKKPRERKIQGKEEKENDKIREQKFYDIKVDILISCECFLSAFPKNT